MRICNSSETLETRFVVTTNIMKALFSQGRFLSITAREGKREIVLQCVARSEKPSHRPT